jgi:hypothetical protein
MTGSLGLKSVFSVNGNSFFFFFALGCELKAYACWAGRSTTEPLPSPILPFWKEVLK